MSRKFQKMGSSNRLGLFDKQVILGSVVLLFLSAIDGALTLWGLRLRVIEEVNPIMQEIITKSPITFIALKLALPLILGIIFWRIHNRSRMLVTYGLRLLLIVYAVVLGIHVYWIINS